MILRDKVAIVTGSSRGIGAATAKLLATQGAKVTVNYLQSREKGEKMLDEIARAGGQAILVRADVTVREDVEAMVRTTPARMVSSPRPWLTRWPISCTTLICTALRLQSMPLISRSGRAFTGTFSTAANGIPALKRRASSSPTSWRDLNGRPNTG